MQPVYKLFTSFFLEILLLVRLELIKISLTFLIPVKRMKFKNLPIHQFQHLSNTFQNVYPRNQNRAITEYLTVWNGLLSFRQYIPLKVAKFGVSLFIKGVAWNWQISIWMQKNITNSYKGSGTFSWSWTHYLDGLFSQLFRDGLILEVQRHRLCQHFICQ